MGYHGLSAPGGTAAPWSCEFSGHLGGCGHDGSAILRASHPPVIFINCADSEYFQTTPPPTSPSLPPVPAPWPQRPDPLRLADCTDALARVSAQIQKLIQFFAAVSCVGQQTVRVYVQTFVFTARRLIRHNPATEPERIVRSPPVSSLAHISHIHANIPGRCRTSLIGRRQSRPTSPSFEPSPLCTTTST